MWVLDAVLLKHLCGHGSDRFLKKRWFESCVPKAGVHLELSDAIKESHAMMNTPLYTWAGAATQSQLRAAHAMLLACEAGHPPAMGDENAEFAVMCHAVLPFFVVHPTSEGTASDDTVCEIDGKKCLQGAAAIIAKW